MTAPRVGMNGAGAGTGATASTGRAGRGHRWPARPAS